MIKKIITLTFALILFLASYVLLRAEAYPPVVFLQLDNSYTLEYFVEDAFQISTSYSYNDGALMSRSWTSNDGNGVFAKHRYIHADEITQIQIIVTYNDLKTEIFEPRIVGLYPTYLPLVLEDK